MLPSLPPSILRIILEPFVQPQRPTQWENTRGNLRILAKCCRTSKLFLSVARPLLYSHIRIELEVVVWEDLEEPRCRIERWDRRLLKTLDNSYDLRKLVKRLTIDGSRNGDYEWGWQKDEYKPDKLIKQLMIWLQEVEVVEIRYLAEYGSIREALRIARLARTMPVGGRRMRMPSLRIVVDEYRDEEREEAGYPLIIETPLEGYKNEQAESESYEGDRWEVMLQPSYTSLKRLDIQLDDKTSLGKFENLERLHFRLSVDEGNNLVRYLLPILPTLPNLQRLAISNLVEDEELSKLLQSSQFANSLPPKLTHLCFHLYPKSADVITCLRALPVTTGLKRLNYDGRKGEEGEVEEECRKRGITLSLTQKWEIWW